MIAVLGYSQAVTNVQALQVGNTIEIMYDLSMDAANVTLMFSQDGGKTYSATPTSISGHVGKDIKAGHNKIIWKILQDGSQWNVPQARFKVAVDLAIKEFESGKNNIIRMMPVEGGTFSMGATKEQAKYAEKDEKPVHQVFLDGFYLMNNTSRFSKYQKKFCCQTWNNCLQKVDSFNTLYAKQLNGWHFAVPTEAQWEYAARGGNKSKVYLYSGTNGDRDVDDYLCNEIGIYGMSGTGWEWCGDWYGLYPKEPQVNPQGPSFGTHRVIRGGGCSYRAYCDDFDKNTSHWRVSNRGKAEPTQKYCLRLALVPDKLAKQLDPNVKYSNESNVLAISAVQVQYFSDYAKPIVEKVINKWQIKGEFEKMADWQKRVNETTRKAKIKELTDKCESDYLKKYTDIVSPNVSLGQYDTENEVFLLTDPNFGNMLVEVPINEGRAFKENWSSAVLTPKYFIENDMPALASLEINMPALHKRYKYSNQYSLKYEQAQVDYNFNPIEIASSGSNATKGQQLIGERKISIGQSEVDKNIPEMRGSNDNTFVVIIANEDYANVASVPYAINDGRVMAKYCQRTLGIPAINIKVYENATLNNISLALTWLKNVCEKYEGEASVIFYYAGHGIPDASDKSAYLLPVDGDGRYVATGYKLDELNQKLGDMPTKSITVLLDACFSGANRDGKMLASERGVALKSRPGQPTGNMVVFSAAQGDETALPNDQEGHGMFTYYLLKKIQETKGDVTLKDLSQYVIREVGRTSAVINKPQTPTITSSASLGTSWQTWKLK